MSTQPTNEQRSAFVAAIFDRAAATYDAVGVPWFTPIAEQLVAALSPTPGQNVLDIGCGRGAALWPLAQAVGPAGAVTGIDLSSAMVEATRTDVQARGLTNVELHVMDAAAPDLPAHSYSVIASSLVLFFLPDPLAALRSWHALLVPGGRMGASTFDNQDPNWVALDDVFTPFLPPQMLDARASGTRGPFASDAGVAELLTNAGLVDVETTSTDLVAVFNDAEHWLTWSWSHGQRAMWEAVPDADRAAVRAGATELLESIAAADGEIRLTQRVRYTLGSAQPVGP